MQELILFIFSLILVLSSSYYLTAVVKSENQINNIIYFIIISISQLIISFEILSLAGFITPVGILTANISVFTSAYFLKKKFIKEKSPFNISYKKIKKFFQPVLKDKILVILAGFGILSAIIALFYTIILPTSSNDSLSYHIARIGFWVQNQTMAHYETSCVRQLIYSVNSEILILWSMVFFKRDYLAQVPQYLAYIGSLFLIFSYLKLLKISAQRIVWTLILFASLPAVIIESSSTQNNLFAGFLLLCSFYLFVFGLKEKDNKAIMFSALAFSIDLGVKYSIFFFIPVFGIIFIILSIKERKNEFYKPLLCFILSTIPAFIFLSSYNYILNYIEFNNFFGPAAYLSKMSSELGLKPFIANLIRYSLVYIDFSGIKEAAYLSPLYIGTKNFLFHIFSLKNTDGLAFNDLVKLNCYVHENHSKFGLLGFLVFLPLIFKYSLLKLKKANERVFYIGITGLVTLLFTVAISAMMGFYYWNNRFLLTSVVVSAPVFALCYSRKQTPVKILISVIVIYNFTVVAVTNSSRPFFESLKAINKYGYSKFREEFRLREDGIYFKKSYIYPLINYLGMAVPNNSNIALIFSDQDPYYPLFEKNPGWKLYPLRYENLMKNNSWKKYDFIVFSNDDQCSDVLKLDEVRFDYIIENDRVIFTRNIKGKPLSVYMDKSDRPITEGTPAIVCNIVKFNEIPPEFQLMIIIKSANRNFYVYRNISKKD